MSGPTAISFNGNSLQQPPNIITSEIDHEGTPTKNDQIYGLSHASRSKIPFTSHPYKKIVLQGTIIGSSAADLEQRLDTFRGYFVGIDKNLDITYSSGTRRYIATLGNGTAPDDSNLVIKRPSGYTYAEFTANLIASLPYGEDTFQTTLYTGSGRSFGGYTDTLTFSGSASEQLPIITVQYITNSGNSAASSVVIGNGNTGQAITINRVWAGRDYLVVDTDAKSVTVNGSAVAFTGAFPIFAPGSQEVTYSDSFATRSMIETIAYYRRFL